jgi:hypothetical protein|tara:strand:+ start:136 stop:735 length:600 start_codon:yes stop_codon:yes gene_type:complete
VVKEEGRYKLTVEDEWSSIHPQDLWVYNKLQVSRVLGYECGPAGLFVPRPDFYIIRPCINFMGMGRHARIEYLKGDTEHLHPGEFWCKVFEGEHISVDYYKGEQELTVKGVRDPQDPLYKWKKWYKVEREIPLPKLLQNLDYDWINCEFIGDKLIEIHLRGNPDFRYNNDSVIPVWEGDDVKTYIEDNDYRRLGFILDG